MKEKIRSYFGALTSVYCTNNGQTAIAMNGYGYGWMDGWMDQILPLSLVPYANSDSNKSIATLAVTTSLSTLCSARLCTPKAFTFIVVTLFGRALMMGAKRKEKKKKNSIRIRSD